MIKHYLIEFGNSRALFKSKKEAVEFIDIYLKDKPYKLMVSNFTWEEIKL